MKNHIISKLLAGLVCFSLLVLVLSGCAGTTAPAATTTAAGTTTSASTASITTNPTTTTGNSETATGTITVYVTDAPPDEEITAVVVTVSGLRVHRAETEQEQQQSGTGNQTQEQEQQSGDGGEWIDIPITGNMTTFDLLHFRDIQALFGSANVTAGKYTQVRLAVDAAQVSTADGQTRDATVNSGEIKIVRPFDIVEGETTELLLDFDAEKSVIFTGNGKVMIKPVIKLSIDVKHQGQPDNEQENGDEDNQDENCYCFSVCCDEFAAQNARTGNITVPLGEQFTVSLCSNASTGYQWNEDVPFSVNGTVVQTSHEYVEPGSQGNGQGQGQNQVGEAGLEQWTFTAQAAGETVLYFEYGQPWEGGEKATWTLVLTVTVQ